MRKTVLSGFIVVVIVLLAHCSLEGGDEPSFNPPFNEVSKLTASDAEDGDGFGHAAAVSGDYVIVGAHVEDGGGSRRGAAYIFYRNQGGTDNWGQVKKITASDAENEDRFGQSVSISWDYAIVGAHFEDGAGINRGAAYVHYRNQGGVDNWGQLKKLVASDTEDSDEFGYSVSISGDFAVVGAWREDGAGYDRGAAYIFYRNLGGTNNWGQLKKLAASDADPYDYFGNSVSISGDYAIVGAYYADIPGNIDYGAAYIFYRDQGGLDNWGEVKIVTASDAEPSDYFGCSVSISGDYALAGAYGEDGAGSIRGAAYIYDRNQGGTNNWGQVKKLVASDTEDSDYFGWSVSISGDFAVVGAYREDGAGSQRGAAYIYDRNQGGTNNWGQVMKLTSSDTENYDYFGNAVSFSGDHTIVGAKNEDGAGSQRGAAYVYQGE